VVRIGHHLRPNATISRVRHWLGALIDVDSGDPEVDRRARTLNAIIVCAVPVTLLTALLVVPYPNGPISAAILLVALCLLVVIMWLSKQGHVNAAVTSFAAVLWLVAVGQPLLTGDLSTNMMLVPLAVVMLIYLIPENRVWWLLLWSFSALVVLQVATNDADTVVQSRYVWLLNAALVTVLTIAILTFATSQLTAAVRKEQALAGELSAKDAMLRRLEEAANTDHLTGLLNRRALDRLHQVIPAQSAMALLDLDRFKGVNDGFSHAIGDQLLSQFAGVVADAARPDDLLFRIGGDEFLVVRTHSGPEELGAWLHHVRAVVQRSGFDLPEGAAATFSAGVVDIAGEDLGSALERVDRAMYAAKEAGRNAIVVID